MARLSLLLPAWKTCSPRIEEPYRRVTGGPPDVGGQVGPAVEGVAEGFGEEHCGRDHDPGHRRSGLDKRGGPPAKGPGPRWVMSARCECRAVSWLARWSRTAPAGSGRGLAADPIGGLVDLAC